ncbi:MAG TPA: formylmethanofuran dehydrogenase subunit A [Euryarchaeota archaeon]|nr:formyltransferase/hydrolase complex Fhc subunit A [archaeon BMS3Abin16]GBE56265.1 formyltransferase/hydrolase complex Fhc subunit A [archaeon BMS3Bbin16]HDH27603.1 formylmethanofuran dehydrogenase subunit A [Euryarchaeota archaeon]
MELEIKNGVVFDPLNKVDGEKKDILIRDGRIVEKLKGKHDVIDASGKLVMPGGVEIHSHFAGGKETAGRMLRPEDGARTVYPKRNGLRSGSGYSMPSSFTAGYLYAQMGYTMCNTPAMPPLFARHTHEELGDVPIVDKSAYPTFDGNWFVMRYLKEGDPDKLAACVAWFLRATKGLVIKIVNPGGTENWGWGKNAVGIDDPVIGFDVTPAQIVKGLAEVNERLKLPHSIHLHPNNLGKPGNIETTVETLELCREVKSANARQTVYLTHAQFHSFGGDSWKNFESKADELAKYINRCDHVVCDTGNVTLDETTTMTSDGPMEYFLHNLTHLKWVNKDVELETAPGITPFIYSRKNPVHSVQWAIGLELALLIDDPFKVLLATDHPNGGPFTRYPRIIAWLMSEPYRRYYMEERVHKGAQKGSSLATLDREYTFSDIAVVTRAGQAKALGLSELKGHLGVGAHGDVAIYDIDPAQVDPSKDFKAVEKGFAKTAYTIKDGEIIVKDGLIRATPQGRTYWANPVVDHELDREMLKDVEQYFKKYYSVNLANYPVQKEYLKRGREIQIDARDVK